MKHFYFHLKNKYSTININIYFYSSYLENGATGCDEIQKNDVCHNDNHGTNRQ